MQWWAVAVDAEPFARHPHRGSAPKNNTENTIRSINISTGTRIGLRCSVLAGDPDAAIDHAIAFYEAIEGHPIGDVVKRSAGIEGDLIDWRDGGASGVRSTRPDDPLLPTGALRRLND
jgi:hypothetical protein